LRLTEDEREPLERWARRPTAAPYSRPFVWTKTADEILGTDHHILAKPEGPKRRPAFAFAPWSARAATVSPSASGHGIEFSSALRELGLGLPTHGLLLSLFGFNAGVEVGQALVVAVALPALMLVRTTRWEQRVLWSSSLAILLVGVILFVERVFF
jgi:HupE / UreJ protein